MGTCAKSFYALAGAVALSIPVRANAGEPALADRLFQEALALTDVGNWAAACPKFAESNAADPSVGALLNLAVCSEKAGRFLESKAHYDEAFGRNESTADDARKEAVRAEVQQKLAAHEQRIPRLRVVTEPPDATVTIEGRPASAGVQGTQVDPGMHRIRVSAKGYVDTEEKVFVVERDRKYLEVRLIPESAKPHAPSDTLDPTAPERSDPRSRLIIPGILVVSAGTLVTGAGAGLLLFTASKASDVRQLCGEDARPPTCSGTAEDAALATDLSAEARTFEVAGAVFAGLGSATLAAGIGMLIAGATASRGPDTAVGLTLGPGEVGWTVSGHF